MPTLIRMLTIVCAISLGGCASSPGNQGAGVHGPGVQECLVAQRDQRQWCSNTTTHGLQSTQYRCLEARLRVESDCLVPSG
jgi:hypothetical protein